MQTDFTPVRQGRYPLPVFAQRSATAGPVCVTQSSVHGKAKEHSWCQLISEVKQWSKYALVTRLPPEIGRFAGSDHFGGARPESISSSNQLTALTIHSSSNPRGR
jgi:hypothetical protein